MTSPLVTILMPMRNAGRDVGEALQSILAETAVAFELVVIDDGSTDNSRSVIEASADGRVRLIDGPQGGIAAAFNAGLAVARGKWTMRCDADDLYPPRRIARQVRKLGQLEGFGALCGGFAATDRRGRTRVRFGTPEAEEEITAELRNGKVRTHFCTFATRTDILRELGGMRSFFVTGEDIDVQLRLGEATRVWYEPEIAYVYRIHTNSITHSVRSAERDYYEAEARRLQQQRIATGIDDLDAGIVPAKPAFGSDGVGSATEQLQGILVAASWSALQSGDRAAAIRGALRAALARPTALSGWRNLAALMIKASLPRSTRVSRKP